MIYVISLSSTYLFSSKKKKAFSSFEDNVKTFQTKQNTPFYMPQYTQRCTSEQTGNKNGRCNRNLIFGLPKFLFWLRPEQVIKFIC